MSWSNRAKICWSGPRDNGTVTVEVDGVEVERFEGISLEAPCALCGKDDPPCERVELYRDELRAVHETCWEKQCPTS